MAKKRRSSQFKDSSQIIDIAEAREKRQERRKKQQKKPADENKEIRGTRRRNLQQMKMRRIAIYAIAIILIAVVVGGAVFKIVSLKQEQKELQAKQKALKEEQAALKEELKHVNDPDYIEEMARERLRLVLPGEQIYIFPSDDSSDKPESETEESKNED